MSGVDAIARLKRALQHWGDAERGDVSWNLAVTLGGETGTVVGSNERSRSDYRQRRAAALRAEGVPDKQIARKLGCDPKTIRNWLGPRETAT